MIDISMRIEMHYTRGNTMYRLLGSFVEERDYTDFGFRDLNRWTSKAGATQRVASNSMWTSALTMGDENKGPALLFIALAPGITPDPAPAHMHASDNWRMSLRGVLPMGPEVYHAGEFRFQRGRKPYPSDSYAHGAEGGWMVLCFADRRGIRVRHVDRRIPHNPDSDRALAEWLDVRGDLVSDDPADEPGPSAMATTLSTSRTPHLNGTFADTSTWEQIGDVRISVGLQGDPVLGPVLVMLDADPGALAEPAIPYATDVFRMVVGGSCRIGDTEFLPGDMRVQAADSSTGEVVAGPDGLLETIIFADRRAVAALEEPSGWLAELRRIAAELSAQLDTDSAGPR
jgi:hypothetical protein